MIFLVVLFLLFLACLGVHSNNGGDGGAAAECHYVHEKAPGEKEKGQKISRSKNNGMSYSFVFFVVCADGFSFSLRSYGHCSGPGSSVVLLPLIMSLEFFRLQPSLRSFSFCIWC